MRQLLSRISALPGKGFQGRGDAGIAVAFSTLSKLPGGAVRPLPENLFPGANTVGGLIPPLMAVSLLGTAQLLIDQQLPAASTGLGPVGTLRGIIQDVNLPRNQFLLKARGREHLFVMAPRCK